MPETIDLTTFRVHGFGWGLRPCECGQDDKFRLICEAQNWWHVECPGCLRRGVPSNSPSMALKNWNQQAA